MSGYSNSNNKRHLSEFNVKKTLLKERDELDLGKIDYVCPNVIITQKFTSLLRSVCEATITYPLQ